MSQPGNCPYCGCPQPAGAGEGAIDSLYQEVRRIRELAEDRETAEDRRRVADLTREVHELRATVARLRATSTAARPAHSA